MVGIHTELVGMSQGLLKPRSQRSARQHSDRMTMGVIGWIRGVFQVHKSIGHLFLNVSNQGATSEHVQHLRSPAQGEDWTTGIKGQAHQCKLKLILRHIKFGVTGPLHGVISIQAVRCTATILTQNFIRDIITLNNQQAIHWQVFCQCRHCQGCSWDHNSSTSVLLNQIQVVLAKEIHVLAFAKVPARDAENTRRCRPRHGKTTL
mmetsp:Transcript_38896/g.72324  ORF Transcript_38896/g.72324 Transcript_38896/m.72324 type:complete len:205 (-) Transcript_38896:396-1010(-)